MVVRSLLAAFALGVAPSVAAGAERVVRDGQGRNITFDVQAPSVDVAAYARVLRNAVHGDEIEDVTIVIVPASRVARRCGSSDAGACYGVRRGVATIVVRAGSGSRMAHTLLHEYGHHIDRAFAHGGTAEPNGTPRWWAARRMGERLRSGAVSQDYRRGWTRSVGEIFAEDYVALNMRSFHRIDWLRPPSAGVLTALRRDLTGRATGPAPAEPPADPGRPPVTVPLNGLISGGESRVEQFGLLGPGRRIQVSVAITSVGADPARVRADIDCDGRALSSAEGADAVPLTLDIPDAGPARCTLTLTGVAGVADVQGAMTLSVVG